MSAAAREALVNSGHIFFRRDSQRTDLLDESITQTTMIAHMAGLVAKGYHIELTAVKTDHRNDSALGEHCHFNGYAYDCWPLTGPTPGAWLDAGDPIFQRFLTDAESAPYHYQTGLAGSADTAANRAVTIAVDVSDFEDSGDDHVHFGTHFV